MRKVLSGLVCACVFACAAAAQQSASQTPTFRSGVALVTIDVTVLDKDGKPVPGLTADEFDIKLNGKSQPVRGLAYVQAAAATPVAAPAATDRVAAPLPAAAPAAAPAPETPRRTITNADAPSRAEANAVLTAAPSAHPAAPAPPAESRVFVMLVDDLSFSPLQGKAMFTAASRFIDRIPASDPVGFATTTGAGAINPTRDRAVLKNALAKVSGSYNDPRGIAKSGATAGSKSDPGPDQSLGIDESIDIERGDETLLREVIVRECFQGNASAVAGQSAADGGNTSPISSRSVADLLIQIPCASDLQREAKRVAALSRQNKLRQIQGVQSVIDAMKVAGGIRHLVLLTEGLPVSREIDDLKPIVRSAAVSGVQISVLLEDPQMSMDGLGPRASMQANDTSTGTGRADRGETGRARQDAKLFVDGAQTMTEMMGGSFYRVVGNADGAFDKVLLASSAVYRLGVELPAGATPGKELTVAAAVKRPGLTARTGKLAIAIPPDAPAPSANVAAAPSPSNALTTADRVPVSIDDVLKGALSSTTVTRDVPMRMALSQRRSATNAGQVDVSLNLSIPSSVKGPIVTFVGLIDSNNAIRNVRKLLEPVSGVDYAAPFLFPLAPGAYRVRVVSADADGAVGTVEMPVNVTLAPFGAFTSSDVLTWVVEGGNRAQLFTIEDIPAGTAELHASIEMYTPGDAASEPPTVKWSLWRDGDAKAVAEEKAAAHASGVALRSDAVFPIASLPAGRYTVRAELMDGDKVAGTRAAVVRKQ